MATIALPNKCAIIMNVKDAEPDELDRLFLGRELEHGWKVESVREVMRDTPATCRTYFARDPHGRPVFVKVLDPRGNMSLADQKIALDQFAYESALLDKCARRNMRRVIRGLDTGSIEVAGVLPIHIRYLVFEWADSDVRSQFDDDPRKHTVAALKWLHHMATALQELHFSRITHEDVRPANVLVMPGRDAKLGDLGSAHDSSAPRPHGDAVRDVTWAPPEYLYNEVPTSLDSRCAADMYQLGSLAVFLFTSIGLTAHVAKHMPHMHHWTAWKGSYRDVLPYLRLYHNSAMQDFSDALPEWLREKLVVLVRQLGDPDPNLRGHPRNRAGAGTTYGFERFVSAFRLLTLEAERQ